jgi:hypothetical protein
MSKIAPCKNCGKETWNETIVWSGYCSKKCEKEAKENKNWRLLTEKILKKPFNKRTPNDHAVISVFYYRLTKPLITKYKKGILLTKDELRCLKLYYNEQKKFYEKLKNIKYEEVKESE